MKASTAFILNGTKLPLKRLILTNKAKKEIAMLYYTLIFLVIALVAGALGFGGIAGASAGIAQVLFFIFLALLVISLIASIIRKV